MRYRNASEIFPDKLLKEIQKYSAGELIYIPEANNKKRWGEKTVPGTIMLPEMRKSVASAGMESPYRNWHRNMPFPTIPSAEFYISNIKLKADRAHRSCQLFSTILLFTVLHFHLTIILALQHLNRIPLHQ